MINYFHLKHRKPVPFKFDIYSNPVGYVKELKKVENYHDKRVRRTYISKVWISTVFLGLDHYMGMKEPHTPVLFETMIFGLNDDEYQTRCCTHRDALKMHWVAVELAKGLIKNDKNS